MAGEAAGTFGVYRPGGSALNSTQVGGLRAAEHIAKSKKACASEPKYDLPDICYGTSNLQELRGYLQTEMSKNADFDRSISGMKALFEEISTFCETFFEQAVISTPSEIAELFKLYDMALTQRGALSAMICSAEAIGTHGSAFVDRLPDRMAGKARTTRTVTRGAQSEIVDISPMPDPELWFETLLARQRAEKNL